MEWDTVFSSRDQVEAALIKGLLESAGIQVVQVLKGLKSLTPIFGMGAPGDIELKVSPDRAELARAIIAARPEPEEGEEPEGTEP